MYLKIMDFFPYSKPHIIQIMTRITRFLLILRFFQTEACMRISVEFCVVFWQKIK